MTVIKCRTGCKWQYLSPSCILLSAVNVRHALLQPPQSGFALQVKCSSVAGSSRSRIASRIAYHRRADQHEGEVEQGDSKVTTTLPTLPALLVCGQHCCFVVNVLMFVFYDCGP
jgi:hypothetical protein